MLFLSRNLVRLLSVLVPGHRRADWVEEWQAELICRWTVEEGRASRGTPSVVDMIGRGFAALADALWLLRNERSQATLSHDLRFAIRMLTKRPGFTIVTVLTMTLGIGANAAIFSVVNGVLLRPLPYEDPHQLVRVWEISPRGDLWTFSPPNLVNMREAVQLFDDVVAVGTTSVTLTGEGSPERVSGMRVSAGFFELLAVPFQHGRPFLPEEDRAGAAPVMILGNAFWQSRFGGRQDIVGQTVTLNGVPRTVVGITPPDFQFARTRRDVWVPWAFDESDLANRGAHWISALGRLKAGIAIEAARTEVQEIAARLAEAYPKTNEDWSATVEPLHENIVADARAPLLVLLGAVGLVLLIACANVANLLLARAEARHREMAVRTALGAGRARLVRQLITESVILSGIGGVLGLALAYWGVAALRAGIGSDLPRVHEIGIDGPVLGFTAAVALLAGVLVGSIPALQIRAGDLQRWLRDGGRSSGAPAGRRRVRQALVVSEMALALVLVIGAGLLLQSFWRLRQVDAGFRAEGVLTARVSLPRSQYDTRAEIVRFYRDLLASLRNLTGVERAGAIGLLPVSGGDQSTTITIVGRPDEEGPDTEFRAITPDYFATMGIPLLRGRMLEERDAEDAPAVVVVNEALVKRHFPDDDPLGKRISTGWSSHPESIEIVGVVANVTEFGLDQNPVPTMYWAHGQLSARPSMSIVVRTESHPLGLVPALQSTVSSLDGDLPIYRIATVEDLVERSVASERFAMLLLGTFASVALLLGMLGIYGVMSYTVSQCTNEVGLRLALGAHQRDVLALVIRQGVALAILGVAIGAAAAFAVNRVLSQLLFGISATDPFTFGAVALLLTGVAILACYLPARRAAKTDPMEALRCE